MIDYAIMGGMKRQYCRKILKNILKIGIEIQKWF